MIDTEHVKCDTCTAPEPMELDAKVINVQSRLGSPS